MNKWSLSPTLAVSKLRHDSKNVPATATLQHSLHIVFLDSQHRASLSLRPPTHGGMTIGTETAGIVAQPLFVKLSGDRRPNMNGTYTFIVFFLTAKLHELTAKMQERMGRMPDVLVSKGRVRSTRWRKRTRA